MIGDGKILLKGLRENPSLFGIEAKPFVQEVFLSNHENTLTNASKTIEKLQDQESLDFRPYYGPSDSRELWKILEVLTTSIIKKKP